MKADLDTLDLVMALVSKMESLQSDKVIELARRILPHLTAEDIRNPHDFPELSDIDWHFADGQLAGIQSVLVAIRAMKNRTVDGSGQESL